MTKDILNQLIAHYEKGVIEISKSENFRGIMFELCVECGICSCAMQVFKVNIHAWSLTVIAGYWTKEPYFCDTKEEIVETMQWRIDKMKSLLHTVN